MAIVRRPNGTFAPGGVPNPQGVNQWTRRAEIEQLWLRLLEEVDVQAGRSRIEQILDRLIEEAIAGRSWAIGMVLDRILPPTRREEIQAQVQAYDPEELGRRLAAFLAPHRDRYEREREQLLSARRQLIDERGSV